MAAIDLLFYCLLFTCQILSGCFCCLKTFFRFSLYRVQCSSEHYWKPNLQLGPRKFLSQVVHRATAEKQRQTIPTTASPFQWHFCWVRVKFAEPDGQSQVELLEELKSYQLGRDFKLSIMSEGRLLFTLC